MHQTKPRMCCTEGHAESRQFLQGLKNFQKSRLLPEQEQKPEVRCSVFLQCQRHAHFQKQSGLEQKRGRRLSKKLIEEITSVIFAAAHFFKSRESEPIKIILRGFSICMTPTVHSQTLYPCNSKMRLCNRRRLHSVLKHAHRNGRR